MTLRKPLILLTTLLALASSAWAKLPAPSDEAKAKAAETAAKAAYAGKLDPCGHRRVAAQHNHAGRCLAAAQIGAAHAGRRRAHSAATCRPVAA